MSKLIRGLALASALLAAGLIVLYGFRQLLIMPVIKQGLVFVAQHYGGVRLSVGRVSGNLISGVRLEQIKMRGTMPESPLVSLTVSKLEAKYSLGTLRRGPEAFLASLSLKTEGVRAQLLFKPAAAPSSAQPKTGKAQPAWVLPSIPPLPKIYLEDARLDIEAPGIRIPGLVLAIRPEANGGTLIHVAGNPVVLSGSGWVGRSVAVEGDFRYAPEEIVVKRFWLDGQPVLPTAWLKIHDRESATFEIVARLFSSRLAVSGRYNPKRVYGEFDLSPVKLNQIETVWHLPLKAGGGVFEARGSADIPLANPAGIRGSVAVHWVKGKIAGRPIDRLTASVAAGQGTIRLPEAVAVSGVNRMRLKDWVLPSALLWDGPASQWLGQSQGEFLVRLGDLPSALGIGLPKPVPIHTLVVKGRLKDGTASLSQGTLETSRGQVQINTFSLGLSSLADSWREMPFSVSLSAQLADLEFWAGLLGGPRVKGSLTASVIASGRPSNLTATARIASGDLFYSQEAPSAVLAHSGNLQAEAEVRGAIDALAGQGRLTLANGQLQLGDGLPLIREINLKALVQPDVAEVERLTARIGGAPVSITGTVKAYLTAQPRLAMMVRGENLLLFRSDGLRVRSDARIFVGGELSRLRVRGTLEITDGLYTRDIDFLSWLKGSGKPQARAGLTLFSLPEPPLKHMRLNVKISANRPFRIKNNAANGSVRPELTLSGTGELPVLTGTVYLDPTRIALPAGTLTIQSGVVRFLDNAPDTPQLDLSATTKMQGYDITLGVQGPYHEPVITLSSVPPLANDDLLLLVLTGQLPTAAQSQNRNLASALNMAVYLSRGLLGPLLGLSGSGGETVFDRLQLTVGSDITQNGRDTVETQFYLTDDWPVQGSAIYLTSDLDQYDQYNGGVKIVFRFK